MMTLARMPGLKRQKPHAVAGRTDLLNGRRAGRDLADQLLVHLAASEPDSILPVDFGRVSFMDFSCADELMTRVLRRIRSGELGTRFILLQDIPPSVEENLVAVFAIRDLVCPKLTKAGQIELLGKIGPELAATYKLAVRKGTITARDVMAIAPNVGISAISNRLAKLQTMVLLVRTLEVAPESGGRQFVYQAIC
jgi:hypothetical protein